MSKNIYSAKKLILSYLPCGGEKNYLIQCFEKLKPNELKRLIISLLKTNKFQQFAAVNCFTIDLRKMLKGELYKPYQAILNDPAIIKILQKQCLSSRFNFRRDATWALYNRWHQQSLPHFMKSFDTFVNSQPIDIPHLCGQILSMFPSKQKYIYNKMLKSESYLTRWALIELIDGQTYRRENKKQHLDILNILLNDSSSYIRDEAKFLINEIKHPKKINVAKLLKDIKNQKVVYDTNEPVRFTDLAVWFSNEKVFQSSETYTLKELQEFVLKKLPKLQKKRIQYNKKLSVED